MGIKDFRAKRLRASQIIGSGSKNNAFGGLGYGPHTVIYSASKASDFEGGVSDSAMTSSAGRDADLFVSGVIGSRNKWIAGTATKPGGTSIFSGDLHVSGNLSVGGSGGGGGGSADVDWVDGGNKLKTTSSVSIDSDGKYVDALAVSTVPQRPNMKDVFFFVSGARDNRGSATIRGTAVFGGDLVVSGTLYADKQIIEVDEAVTGSLMVSGSLIVSESVSIHGTKTVESRTGVAIHLFDKAGYGSTTNNAIVWDDNHAAIYESGDNLRIYAKDKVAITGSTVFVNNDPIAVKADVNVYVSGSADSFRETTRGTTVFMGDNVISGALKVDGKGPGFSNPQGGTISGSIHFTHGGIAYLKQGANISIVSSSNGQITIDTRVTPGTMSSFTVSGDSGTQTIENGNDLKILGGTGTTSDVSATDTATININYAGGSNAILATGAGTPVGADTIWFSDADDSNIKKATISTLPFAASDTTYTLTATQDGSDVDILLDASAGSDSTLQLTAGSNITLTRTAADNITIAAAADTDTTYTLSATQDGSDVDILLDASAGSDSTLQLTAGSNVTLTRNAADNVTIAATDTNTTYTAGDGLDLTGTEFSVDYAGADNAILVAGAATPVGADTIWFSDADDSTIKKATVSSLPFGAGTMSSFTIRDPSANTSAITDGDTLNFVNTADETTVAVSGDNVTFGLSATGVSAGSYTYTSLTVDVNGRITAASSGTPPSSLEWTDEGDILRPADGNADSVGIGGTGTSISGYDIFLSSSGGAIFNQLNRPQDFRVASKNKSHAIFVSGNLDQVLILSGGDADSYNSAAGPDISFHVSGGLGTRWQRRSGGGSPAHRGVSVFEGDVVISGSLFVSGGRGELVQTEGGSISGSIHKTAEGLSYLVAGTNVTIVSGTNGQVTISSTASGGTMSSFTLAGDSGSSQTIENSNTLTVAGGTGLSSAAGATDTVTVSIDYTGADNAILAAGAATPVGADTIWFSDADDSTIKKATVASLPFADGTMSSFNAAGDSGSSQPITNGNTLTIAGGTGVNTAASATDTVTINLDYSGTDNFIDSATNLEGTPIATNDTIVYHDNGDNDVKKGLVSDLPFGAGTMSSFTLAGDSGTQTISDGDTLDVEGGTGITTLAGATDKVTVNIDYDGTDNFIEVHSDSATPVTGDKILFHDITDNDVKKCTIGDLPFAAGTMSNFTVAADAGSSQTISDGNTLTITGGTGIDSAASATDTVTLTLDVAELPALGTTAATNDYVVIEDVTDNVSKKVLVSNLPTSPSEWTDEGSILRPADGVSENVGIGGTGTTETDYDIMLKSDGAAVFNEQGASVDFRVESDNQTHMLFVDGSTDRVGIGTSIPSSPLHVQGNLDGTFVALIDNDQSSNGHVLKLQTDGNGSGSRLLEMEDGDGDTLFRARADGRFGFGANGVASMGAGTFVVGIDGSHTADIAISKRMQHLGDSDTYMDFPGLDKIDLVAGARNMVNMVEGATDTRVLILSGGSGQSPDEAAATDVCFYVSGAQGSRNEFGRLRGTSLFGGDVVMSGALYIHGDETDAQGVTAAITLNSSNQSHIVWDSPGNTDPAEADARIFESGGNLFLSGTTNVEAIAATGDVWLSASDDIHMVAEGDDIIMYVGDKMQIIQSYGQSGPGTFLSVFAQPSHNTFKNVLDVGDGNAGGVRGVVINDDGETTYDFRAETDILQAAVLVDAGKNQVLIGTEATFAVNQTGMGDDTTFFVSGSRDAKGTTRGSLGTGGVAVVAGDLIVSGAIYEQDQVRLSLYTISDTNITGTASEWTVFRDGSFGVGNWHTDVIPEYGCTLDTTNGDIEVASANHITRHHTLSFSLTIKVAGSGTQNVIVRVRNSIGGGLLYQGQILLFENGPENFAHTIITPAGAKPYVTVQVAQGDVIVQEGSSLTFRNI